MKQRKSSHQFQLSVSFLQLVNESTYDLLDPSCFGSPSDASWKPLPSAEAPANRTYVSSDQNIYNLYAHSCDRFRVIFEVY